MRRLAHASVPRAGAAATAPLADMDVDKESEEEDEEEEDEEDEMEMEWSEAEAGEDGAGRRVELVLGRRWAARLGSTRKGVELLVKWKGASYAA